MNSDWCVACLKSKPIFIYCLRMISLVSEASDNTNAKITPMRY